MLQVIGIGPGRPEWLPPAIIELVQNCEVLIGGSRALELFPDFQGSRYTLSGKLADSIEVIRKALQENKVVGVLVSGDPGFFSFLPRLKKEFPEEKMDVHPGISSLQFAFARAELAWQEAAFASVHGRDLSVLPQVITRPTAVLTGGENTPQKIAQYYLDRGCRPKISVGNALSYPEEFWATMDAEQLAQEKTSLKNAIVILHPSLGTDMDKDTEQRNGQVNPGSSANSGKKGIGSRLGIPDEEFLRGKVPMTKSEIRVQVLAKAQISKTDNVVDIGAGTGSISIEAAGLASEGMVYAIEHHTEAQELILANQDKFGVDNLRLIPGAAPDVFGELPTVDVCIIGGSNGRLAEILAKVPLADGGRIVITAVTIETVAQGLKLLSEYNYQDIDTISIQAVRWKAVQTLHMAQALNPIFIISARKGEAS
ncbi:precorrin-6y C5,15-methyltransferase (decarboxylating), CbiE subunit,precorrin-6Y C5,15-methyltransferase (decarboxylating), CbiT subunit [Desulfosporosinus orientis DSM 765]|uniref:Precorrin-6y C5,15-methyltransferase (Decarboxylating), CbiE subunit,precorrin-6Y C5,15-methyltransferase (Decarboxylating), CbiT subunit n=1 Tax=Desulfosporosinus orientis (strain ATCC 19365 / DSM 765 / NCIMB 8382 / VKM B-1628 / Singapore I) TaxID=768706 RepID=G7WDJ8_DESOD|nr:bifunctional cobalt-precorrin-7 (C(5))-methyltransferase/cobalt-precorrin-6B (C(15))-methyltransferase [Desulfosporosinus orientis]AET68323.1 precorrin-6y C5,15-methyltransferase (decarboxylating), CbiE subunit,precorrin-6Y C5,15-methyltransferase (decarboxylating), CbiT subunit [Desulfosporosinus orientis DSM 765]